MQPVLLHHCNCSYNTPISYSPSIFSQNIVCSHCGSITSGINVQANAKEEADMQQDELTRLFSANMNISQVAPQQPKQQVQHKQHEQPPKQMVYASQHYTHSHHLASLRSIPEPPANTQMDWSELAAILLRNSINPSFLFPSQIDLFQNADDDQRLRLLELWRISPPQGSQEHPTKSDYHTSKQLYDWPPTSLAQEETMAKLRYEKSRQESTQQVHESVNTLYTLPSTQTAEPYMTSGYELMAQREYEQSACTIETPLKETNKYNQATDPVYNSVENTGLWQKNVGSTLDMENTYGAFTYARDMHFQSMCGDEEMVM